MRRGQRPPQRILNTNPAKDPEPEIEEPVIDNVSDQDVSVACVKMFMNYMKNPDRADDKIWNLVFYSGTHKKLIDTYNHDKYIEKESNTIPPEIIEYGLSKGYIRKYNTHTSIKLQSFVFSNKFIKKFGSSINGLYNL